MLIPYRVKNPPKKFPVATVTLIALNTLVFACTSNYFLAVRPEMVDEYALRWGVSPLITIFTAMFLHGDILHLLGNMLFLWVFGPAVEDRLNIGLYLGLYFIAGFAGDVAQGVLGATCAIALAVPSLGASGCIMGVLGAYWYLYAWSPVCMFYWFGMFFRGTFEAAAIWVIGAYFVLDLFGGFIGRFAGAVGGVANFAHVGGAFIGAILVWSLKLKRDSSEVSRVKAAHAEYKDINLLTCDELKKLVADAPEDEDLLASYAEKAMRDGKPEDIKFALSRDLKTVLTRCPAVAVYYLSIVGGTGELFSAGDLLYLAKWCETNNRGDQALQFYNLIEGSFPDAPELEMALYRSGAVYWYNRHDSTQALQKLELLLSKFPNGPHMFEAEDLRDSIKKLSGGMGFMAA